MSEVTGIVKTVNKKGTGILLDISGSESWWNCVNKNITLDYKKLKNAEVILDADEAKHIFSNIKILKIAEAIGKSDVGGASSHIIRQNALSHADSFLPFIIGILPYREYTAEELKEIYFEFAKCCEDWVTR